MTSELFLVLCDEAGSCSPVETTLIWGNQETCVKRLTLWLTLRPWAGNLTSKMQLNLLSAKWGGSNRRPFHSFWHKHSQERCQRKSLATASVCELALSFAAYKIYFNLVFQHRSDSGVWFMPIKIKWAFFFLNLESQFVNYSGVMNTGSCRYF